MQVLVVRQISTGVFHAWNSIELDSAWVEDSHPCHLSFFLRVFPRVTIRHSRVFGFGILN